MQYLNTAFVLAATTLLGANAASSCPQDDGRRFYGTSGVMYELLCHTDVNPGSDIVVNYMPATDYQSCAISCDAWNAHYPKFTDCTAAVWREDLNNCYLKSSTPETYYSEYAEAAIPVEAHPQAAPPPKSAQGQANQGGGSRR